MPSKRIPSRHQIFDQPIEVSHKDYLRLQPHLTGWTKLNELFLLGLNAPDLRRLVVIELGGSQRRPILTRLLGRLAKVEREHRMQRIDTALLPPI